MKADVKIENKEHRLKKGKLPENVLKRAVLNQIRNRRDEVLGGAGIGRDCAYIRFLETETLVTCMQEAAVITEDDRDLSAGRLFGAAEGLHGILQPDADGQQPEHDQSFLFTMAELIQKCANNLAAGGALPIAAELTLLLPEETEEEVLRTLMTEAERKCHELFMQIIGGQTSVSAWVTAPVAVVTGYGKVLCQCFPGVAAPGLDLVVSKWIGLQGTALLARWNREKLLGRYPAYLVEEAASFDRYLSVLPEAFAAVEFGVAAMHDVSEGGILRALWELAEGAGAGLTVDMRKLPLRQETVEVCEFCNVNPYQLLSGGCLLMAAADGEGLAEDLKAKGIPAQMVGRITDSNDRILVNEGEIRYLERPR